MWTHNVELHQLNRYVMEFAMDSFAGVFPGNTVTDGNGLALASVMDESNRDFEADMWVGTNGITCGIFQSRKDAVNAMKADKDTEEPITVIPLKLLSIGIKIAKVIPGKDPEPTEYAFTDYTAAMAHLAEANDPQVTLVFEFLPPKTYVMDHFDLFDISHRNVGEVTCDLIQADNVIILSDTEFYINPENAGPIAKSLGDIYEDIEKMIPVTDEQGGMTGWPGLMPGDMVYLAKVTGEQVDWMQVFID